MDARDPNVPVTAVDPADSYERNAAAMAAGWSPEIVAFAETLTREIDFARRVRDFRDVFGLRQRELETIIGVEQGDISKLEHGKLNPTVERMNGILAKMREYAQARSAQAQPVVVHDARRFGQAILPSAHDAAAYLRGIYADHDDEFTMLKLQKLLYFGQGYALVLFGRPLFPERIKAWAWGPVVPQVRKAFEDLDDKAVLPRPENFDLLDVDEDARRVLDRVYAEFGHLAAWALVDITHQEKPWVETAQSEEIDRGSIAESCRLRMDGTVPSI